MYCILIFKGNRNKNIWYQNINYIFVFRDEKKKRRLFSNNRSYLDFEVERSESFIVPSPLNYASRRLRPASVPEAPEEPASEEEFAAGGLIFLNFIRIDLILLIFLYL